MKNVLLFVTVLLTAGLGFELAAAEVSPETASEAVRVWHRRGNRFGRTLRGKVHSARQVQQGKARFNVVRFSEGGFVITPADTRRRPVVFVGEGGDYDENDTNHPLYAMLQRDLGGVADAQERVPPEENGDGTARAPLDMGGPTSVAAMEADAGDNPAETGAEEAWAELLAEGGRDGARPSQDGIASAPTEYATSPVEVSDIRVEPLCQTTWGQGNGVFNYYTPNHYVCGCVATSLAQIMRYFEWPNSSFTVPQYTSQYTEVNGTVTPKTMMGGTYSWSDMPYGNSGYTSAQKEAVSKLCYDCGVACSMDWRSNGSGTPTMLQQTALVNRFGYSNCVVNFNVSDSSASYTGLEPGFRRAVIANFDNGRPVGVAVPGHSVVFDGYAFTAAGDLSYHVNFGWYGSGNGWYIPPNMQQYSSIETVNYNIFTTETAGSSIISGRVLGLGGAPVQSAVVTLYQVVGNVSNEIETVASNAKGIWSFVAAPNAKYVVHADNGLTQKGDVTVESLAANVSVRLVGTDGVNSYYTGTQAVFGNSSENDIQLQKVYPDAPITDPNLPADTVTDGWWTTNNTAQTYTFTRRYDGMTSVFSDLLVVDGFSDAELPVPASDDKAMLVSHEDPQTLALTWRGLSAGAWVQLEGPPPVNGRMLLRIDLRASDNKVRYSIIDTKGTHQLMYNSQEWLAGPQSAQVEDASMVEYLPYAVVYDLYVKASGDSSIVATVAGGTVIDDPNGSGKLIVQPPMGMTSVSVLNANPNKAYVVPASVRTVTFGKEVQEVVFRTRSGRDVPARIEHDGNDQIVYVRSRSVGALIIVY